MRSQTHRAGTAPGGLTLGLAFPFPRSLSLSPAVLFLWLVLDGLNAHCRSFHSCFLNLEHKAASCLRGLLKECGDRRQLHYRTAANYRVGIMPSLFSEVFHGTRRRSSPVPVFLSGPPVCFPSPPSFYISLTPSPPRSMGMSSPCSTT